MKILLRRTLLRSVLYSAISVTFTGVKLSINAKRQIIKSAQEKKSLEKSLTVHAIVLLDYDCRFG